MCWRDRFVVAPVQDSDRPWVVAFLNEHWGGTQIISRERVHQADGLAAFVAVRDGQPVGLVTYHVEGTSCEIVSIDSLVEGIGIGAALIEAVKAAVAGRCSRLWLITTNDNLPALRFYQKRGFCLVAVHPGAMDAARRLKPSIPLVGRDGIPLRDEIELEMALG
jgi:DNA-3-methyladenine glycosylase I